MKPSDYYIGMSEFFSVLIPGTIVTTAIYVRLLDVKFDSIVNNKLGALLLVSYIVGHILFAMGSSWDHLYEIVKSNKNNILLEKIGEIRLLNSEKECSAINKYKWCKSILSEIHPEGYMEVLRKEADSKLFRSILFPLILCIFIVPYGVTKWNVLAILSASFVSFMRFRGQRFKACRIAYTHVIVQHQLDKLGGKYT